MLRRFWPRAVLIILLMATVAADSVASEQNPPTLPRRYKPSLAPRATPPDHRSSAIGGPDIKMITAPANAKNLRWQQIMVGKEKIDGATLVGIKPGSVWSRLGLQSGDVIVNIRGKDVKSNDDLDKALSPLSDKDESVDLKIIREHQEVLIDYKLNW